MTLREPQISLVVPFRADLNSPHRIRTWTWLQTYWMTELPDAEIVVGISESRVFSKTEAVNDAVAQSRGRIIVILDADCYIRGSVIKHCADAIDEANRRHQQLWFIPFRHLYRLTEDITEDVLSSDPHRPLRFPTPPDNVEVESTLGSMHGHRFGAMIQILPREAFLKVGCMDPRFKGWGGEDIAFVRAVDTLYAKHKTTDNDVLHLWHPKIGVGFKDRMWEGQGSPRSNENLAQRYNRATGDRVKMRSLVDEGCESPNYTGWRKWWHWLKEQFFRYKFDLGVWLTK